MTTNINTVFPIIVGSGRSGTTLLRTILNAHPELAVANEPQFMGSVARQRNRLESDGLDVPAFLRVVYGNANFERLGLDHTTVELALRETDPGTLADAIRCVFAVFAEREGKNLYGDKTPGYVVQMPVLSDMFPEAQFIHLIRDGRDVALSYIERPWGPSTVGESALYWRSRVGRGRAAGNKLGSRRYLEARYEDLVADPETTIRRICEFLTLDFAPKMLEYQNDAEKFIADSHQPEAFTALTRPPTSGLRDWSTSMDPTDVELFETIAGGLLSDLGYSRRSTDPDISTRVRARWEEALWSSRRARAAFKGKVGR